MAIRFPYLGSSPPLLKLVGLILLGSILACGRFDWSANFALALRSYTLSWFFFVLILAGGYALASALSLSNRRGFWPVLSALSVLLNIPYFWVGLDRFFYLKTHPITYGVAKGFTPEWLGRGGPGLPMNSTDLYFAAVMIAAGCVWFAIRRRDRTAGKSPWAIQQEPRRLFLVLFLLINLESWLHLSNRSPYTYISHFEKPSAENYVYAYELLPDGRGVVNADFGYFVRLEELFQGNGATPPMMLVRRAFPFYLSSHLSFFIGHFHAFLILNLLFWSAAIIAIYYFCREVTGSTAAATSAAGFVSCAPGFIMYAAQPMSYLPGHAMLAIGIFLYHRVIVETRLSTNGVIAGTSIFMGLMMLTYDTFTWSLFFVAYAVLNRVSVVRALVTISGGVVIYFGFLALIFQVFKFVPETENDRHIGEAFRNLLSLFQSPTAAKIVPLAKDFLGRYLSQVMAINFYVPFALAAVGLVFAPTSVRLRALALLLPSLAAFFVLHFGESYLASLSRFNYAAYPAVILLASVAVGRAHDYLQRKDQSWLALGALLVPFGAAAVIGNIDVFGFHPQLYFRFYYSAGGFFE